MARIKDLHRTWSQDAGYRTAYDALDDEFRLARVLIDTRSRAGLSQAELAVRMKANEDAEGHRLDLRDGRSEGRVGAEGGGPVRPRGGGADSAALHPRTSGRLRTRAALIF